jgi:hypothetical protein
MINDPVYQMNNGVNPAKYSIEVVHEPDLDQYRITLTILGKKFSRMEKTRAKAVEYAKRINTNIESAFLYMWEDNS